MGLSANLCGVICILQDFHTDRSVTGNISKAKMIRDHMTKWTNIYDKELFISEDACLFCCIKGSCI